MVSDPRLSERGRGASRCVAFDYFLRLWVVRVRSRHCGRFLILNYFVCWINVEPRCLLYVHTGETFSAVGTLR